MNFGRYKFCVDHDAKNRLSLSFMVLEKKRHTFPSVKMKGTLRKNLEERNDALDMLQEWTQISAPLALGLLGSEGLGQKFREKINQILKI